MAVYPADATAEFSKALKAIEGRLHAYIHMLTLNLCDADDLYERTCLAIWQKRKRVEPDRDFLVWACGVARSQWKLAMRGRSHTQGDFSSRVDDLLVRELQERQEGELQSRRAAVSRCLAKINKIDRELVRLCFVEQVRVHLVADLLQQRPESVHAALRRTRDALQRCIRLQLAQGAKR